MTQEEQDELRKKLKELAQIHCTCHHPYSFRARSHCAGCHYRTEIWSLEGVVEVAGPFYPAWAAA